MHRARAASPAQSVLLPLALVAATFVVVAGLIVIAVAPPTLVYVLDWVRDTRVEGVAVTGELLALTESQNVYTIDGTLPADVPRLVDAADVCTGLYQQTATAVACVPFSVENATMNFALQPVGAGAALAVDGTNHVRGLVVAGTAGAAAAAVGDDVVLTINATNTVLRAIGGGTALAVNGTDIVRGLLANGTADVSLTQINDDVLLTVDIRDVARLCGTSCGPGDVLAVAPNGACLLCNTGVQAASFMRTCGTCPPFASVRLAANSSCATSACRSRRTTSSSAAARCTRPRAPTTRSSTRRSPRVHVGSRGCYQWPDDVYVCIWDVQDFGLPSRLPRKHTESYVISTGCRYEHSLFALESH